MVGPQIEELRKKYKDNILNYDDIGMLFNAIDTLSRMIIGLKQDIYKEDIKEITIPINEYKELLIIKGKYEEIKKEEK